MRNGLDDWFVHEVLQHEALLTRYLSRRWREQADVADLRQEIYVRIYDAARTSRPLNPKAFLFATARNLIADRLRRARVVAIDAVADLDELDVIREEATPETQEAARQELQQLASALDRLPPRCREVVWLRKVKGLSQKEVAARLSIAEGTVEKQVAKGVRLMARWFTRAVGCAPESEFQAGPTSNEHYGKSRGHRTYRR